MSDAIDEQGRVGAAVAEEEAEKGDAQRQRQKGGASVATAAAAETSEGQTKREYRNMKKRERRRIKKEKEEEEKKKKEEKRIKQNQYKRKYRAKMKQQQQEQQQKALAEANAVHASAMQNLHQYYPPPTMQHPPQQAYYPLYGPPPQPFYSCPPPLMHPPQTTHPMPYAASAPPPPLHAFAAPPRMDNLECPQGKQNEADEGQQQQLPAGPAAARDEKATGGDMTITEAEPHPKQTQEDDDTGERGRRRRQRSPPHSLTNGRFLEYAMLHYDSVAYMTSLQLGIPQYLADKRTKATRSSDSDSVSSDDDRDDDEEEATDTATPAQVADEFQLTLRSASAFLVTLCRLGVVRVAVDDEESVDAVSYALTEEAAFFLTLSRPEVARTNSQQQQQQQAYTVPFVDTFRAHFITPELLLELSSRKNNNGDDGEEELDLMSEHLLGTSPEREKTACVFIRHMNAQSYSCAGAFPKAMGLVVETDGGDDDEEAEDERSSESLTMLDVGGGSAIYTIETVRSNANVRGIVFELPSVKPVTAEYIRNANLSDRIDVATGDFFDPSTKFPSADIVLFANILHDWSDETNTKLLQKAYDCLNPGGRIVVSELLLADDVGSSSPASTSMNVVLLQWVKGRQYRGKELVSRFRRLGFVDSRVVPLVDDYSLVVGTKKH